MRQSVTMRFARAKLLNEKREIVFTYEVAVKQP